MSISLKIKPFSFRLQRPLKTSKGILSKKQGWLIQLENTVGKVGWGEVSPINSNELIACSVILKSLGKLNSRESLEQGAKNWPGSLAFGIGAALAEMDCLIGWETQQEWLDTSQSAFLLADNKSLLRSLDEIIEKYAEKKVNLTFKWKVAYKDDEQEKKLLVQILNRLPTDSRLRLDANGGWNRMQAKQWASSLKSETSVEWIEQPLAPNDVAGLEELSKQIPIALDESLIDNPLLRIQWKS